MWVLLSTAVVLVLVGGALLMFAPVSFGWTAYAPLSGESFSFSGMYPVTPERALGIVLAILGLLLVVGMLGWILGRRAAQRDPVEGADR